MPLTTKSNLHKWQFWCLCLLLLIATGAVWIMTQQLSVKTIVHDEVIVDTLNLRSGDLLFRNGNGGESRLVTALSEGNYSHIGMAFRTPTGWHVVHAVPGETPHHDDTDFLKSEPIDDFFQYERACSGAVARVDCSDSIALRALHFALDKVVRGFAFDHNYDLSDTSQYYCTELIYQAYLDAGINLADNRRQHLQLPGTDGSFIFPSDILESPHIRHIKTLKTRTSTRQ